ncbi:MAG: glycoside hydrolase family 2, partial [Bacteroidia bacterium]
IVPELQGPADGLSLTLRVQGESGIAFETYASPGEPLKIIIPGFKPWSPSSPELYDCEIILSENKKLSDRVSTYFGFREVSLGIDTDGFTKIFLNGKFLFQNGPLDQGFWPDGLYTPPTEEAMKYDLEMTLKLGFNMLRKHVKVENRRFYYWCDVMGLLVWQDMPSGDSYIGGSDPDIAKSIEDTKQFEFELARLIETKFNNPSIIMWVPFNEGWGQFETGRVTDFIRELDPTRLVNSASGWTDRGTGDILDIHHYPDPRSPEPEVSRAIVLGEFGGLGLPVQDHTWEQKNWGYRNMMNSEELLTLFTQYYDTIYRFVLSAGLSAVIYTQTTDVETETNGLLTYDRKVDKMGFQNVSKANKGSLPPG